MRDPKNIVVFSGAGISVTAGLRTYRGPDGLWNDAAIVQAAEARTLQVDPRLSWDHWGGMRSKIVDAQPTLAHRVLAEAEASLPLDYALNIVTQNVDGLHTRAGSKNVIEFHGNVMRSRCTNTRCEHAHSPFQDLLSHKDQLPVCPLCGSRLRPDVVLFGENVDAQNVTRARGLMKQCGTLLVIGTRLEVQPAKSIVDIKKRFYSGVRTIWINVEPAGPLTWSFKEIHLSGADAALPRVLAQIIKSD